MSSFSFPLRDGEVGGDAGGESGAREGERDSSGGVVGLSGASRKRERSGRERDGPEMGYMTVDRPRNWRE